MVLTISEKQAISEAYVSMYESAVDRNVNKAKKYGEDLFRRNGLFGKPVLGNDGVQLKYQSGKPMVYDGDFVQNRITGLVPNARNKADAKYMLGAARIMLGSVLSGNDGDMAHASELDRIIACIADNEESLAKYDGDLNGETLEGLRDIFAETLSAKAASGNAGSSGPGLVRNERYTIVPCGDYEALKRFGPPNTDWCVTTSEDAYSKYTNGGTTKFYVILRDDWRNCPRMQGEGCPMDDYGLSMVAVNVSPDGTLKDCTLRWNHEHGGDDRAMDEDGVSRLVGMDFRNAFPPRTPDEVMDTFRSRDVGNGVASANGFILVRGDHPGEYRCIMGVENGVVHEGDYVSGNDDFMCIADGHFRWFRRDGEFFDPKRYVGNMDCTGFRHLTSLMGCPATVEGDMTVEMTRIKSLEGAPRVVTGNFDCSGTGITSLEGGPEKVGRMMTCTGCDGLVSLRGAPSVVGHGIVCSGCDNLRSLEGAPHVVGNVMDCSWCRNLETFDGAPEKVNGTFVCTGCGSLRSLEGVPSAYGYDFDMIPDIPVSPDTPRRARKAFSGRRWRR